MQSNGHRQIAASLPIVSSIVSSRGPNPLDAEEGEDTDTPTIGDAGESNAGEDEPVSVPMWCSKSCSKSCSMRWRGRAGLSTDNHKRCGFIEWVLQPVIKVLSLVPEAVAISAGSFSHREMVKSMVRTPLCNHSPVYDHHTLNQCIR